MKCNLILNLFTCLTQLQFKIAFNVYVVAIKCIYTVAIFSVSHFIMIAKYVISPQEHPNTTF